MIGLTYIMKIEKITTTHLASLIGITQPTVTQWEKKIRPIPPERLNQLHEIFPYYPLSLFGKDIDERDMITLQNSLLSHHIDLLQEKDDIQSLKMRKALINKREYNKHLIEQQVIVAKIQNVFKESYDISQGLYKDLLIRQNMIEDFDRLCRIEEKFIKILIKHDEGNSSYKDIKSDINQDIKIFIDELKNHVKSLEFLFQYGNTE